MPVRAKVYIALVITLGLAAAGRAVADWESVTNPGRMGVFIALAALASVVKLRLPGLAGTYSLNSVLLLAGAVYLTLPETVFAAVAAVLVQSYFRAERRPAPVQVLFSVSNEAFSVALASTALSYLVGEGIWPFRPALLAAAAAIYFALNTALVSGILSLLGGGSFTGVNRQWYSWSFPYYLLGAAAVGALPLDGRPIDLEACAVLVPLAYLAHFFRGLRERRGAGAEEDTAGPAAIPASAKAFTAAIAAMAGSFLATALARREPVQWDWFLCYLALGAVASAWKVRLPGTTGTISVHYVVMLVAVAHAGMFEALAISAAGPLVQSYWRARTKPQPVQVLFNVSVMVVATGVTFSACRFLPGAELLATLLGFLICAAGLHFLANTILVSIVLSLVEGEPVIGLWRRLYFWAFPIYMVGAAAAGVMVATTRSAGWVPSLLVLPLMAMAQLSYRLHVSGRFRLEAQSGQAGEAA